jgi:hypothetical protein
VQGLRQALAGPKAQAWAQGLGEKPRCAAQLLVDRACSLRAASRQRLPPAVLRDLVHVFTRLMVDGSATGCARLASSRSVIAMDRQTGP